VLSKCEFYSCILGEAKLHGSTLRDLLFTDCKPKSLKVKDVKVVKTGGGLTGGDLSAVLSGALAELQWGE
jgi:hypothetical protein